MPNCVGLEVPVYYESPPLAVPPPPAPLIRPTDPMSMDGAEQGLTIGPAPGGKHRQKSGDQGAVITPPGPLNVLLT